MALVMVRGVYARVVLSAGAARPRVLGNRCCQRVFRRSFSPLAWYNKQLQRAPMLTKTITSGGSIAHCFIRFCTIAQKVALILHTVSLDFA